MSERITLSRGEISVDGVYVGNSNVKKFFWEKGKLFFRLKTNHIDDDALLRFATSCGPVIVKYEDKGPMKLHVHFAFKGDPQSRELDFACDDWLSVETVYEVSDLAFATRVEP